MIKNSGELIVLAQPLIFIHVLIHLLVEFGGGKYQQYKWLKWHNKVVVALCRASSRNSPIGLALYIYDLYSSKLIKTCCLCCTSCKVFPNASDFYKINPLGD